MRKTMFDPTARQALQDRLSRLTPDTQALWGKFSAPLMVCHLTEAMRMTYGDLVIPQKKMFVRYPVIKQLFIYVLPMPKGLPTARQLLARAPTVWHGEVETLRSLIDRFATMQQDRTWPSHPAFGALTGRAWGALAWKHMDHHFRQFAI